MARPGPLPSTNRIGHSPQAEWTDVRDEPYTEGEFRELPAREWHAQTLRWWATIRTLPHARTWREDDWIAAEQLAVLVDKFNTGLSIGAELSEMRKRGDLLGITSEARQKLRIRYVQVRGADPIEAPAVAPGEARVIPMTEQRRADRDRSRSHLLED